MDKEVNSRAIRPADLRAQNLTYPRNQWYVAAGIPEIAREPLGRQILGKDLVFFRTEAGEAVALLDWCPHRGFRLSKSKLVGDDIECGYHGMRFGPSGACTLIPSQDTIPPKMAVRKFPLIERGHYVWIWMGDAEKADPALLPAEMEFEDPKFISRFGSVIPMSCNAAVCLENTIDFTHASLLHPGLLDTDDMELMTTEIEVERLDATTVQTTQRFGRFQVRDYLAESMGMPDGAIVDRVRISREFLPSMHTSVDTYYDPDDKTRILARRIRYAAITPRDDKSCYLISANSGTSTDVGTDAFRAFVRTIMAQDRDAIEFSQQAIEDAEDFKEVSVKADQAALMARRIIAELAAAEL